MTDCLAQANSRIASVAAPGEYRALTKTLSPFMRANWELHGA